MKFLIVLALAAAVSAEADPWMVYGGHYAGHYAPSVYSHWAPSVYAANTYGVKAPLHSNDAVSPWNYAAKGRYHAQSGPVSHIAKREAEPYFYGAYPYAATTYAHAYAPSVYSHAWATPYATPVVHHAAPVVGGLKTYSNDAVKPFNYAAKGQYHADSLGAKHIAKREAEPYFYGAYPYASTYAAPSAYPFVSHASPAVYAHSHPLRVKAYVKHF